MKLREVEPPIDIKWLVIGVVLLAATAGVATALTNGSQVSGTITLNASDGPEVTFPARSEEVDLTSAFPNKNTVDWTGTAGNVTVRADSQVQVQIDQIEGSTTDISNVGSSTFVYVNPDDKQAVEVRDVNYVNVTDMALDDGQTDFTMDGTSEGYINISNLPAGETVVAVNSNGDFLTTADVDSAGWLNLTVPLSTQQVTLQSKSTTTAPVPENPQPEGSQNDFPTTLSVDIKDDDFPNDNVTVDFEHNGNDVGSDFVTTQGGTASTTISVPPRGENTVNVTATDTYGNVNTLNYTFGTPNNITIREERNPDTIIDDRQINATFYAGDTIINRTTSDGNLSMDGLPLDEQIVVELDAHNGTQSSTSYNYYQVESVPLDITKQTDMYMLRDNVDAYNLTFGLDDQTGGLFEGNDPAVRVDRAINQSSFSQPQWEAVYGDELGPAGTTATLEADQRYRVRVINNQGDERVLGALYPSADQFVQLEVGSVSVAPSDPETDWAWNATYNEQGQENVRFYLNDTQQDTDTIYVKVYEWGNESNVLAANQSFTGPYGTFSYSEPVPAAQNESTWVVDVVVVRNGESIRITRPVGPQSPILPGLPWRLKLMISIGTLLIVAGLFSQLNGHIGGLVVAALGAIFWYIDFFPGNTAGIGVVILAMVVAAIIFIREGADQGVSV